jgi:3-methyladenine DNA glycosylase AlkD
MLFAVHRRRRPRSLLRVVLRYAALSLTRSDGLSSAMIAGQGSNLWRVTGASQSFIDDVHAALAAVSDPEKAAPMQAYMKSSMPYRGVQKPARVAALRPVFRRNRLPDRDTWEATVRLLWDEAVFREDRYAATDLARHRTYAEWATDPRSLVLYDHMIVSGAWWDHVDEIAIKLIGPLLRAHPDVVTRVIRRWSRDPDRWRRRASLICQAGLRDATDTGLLAECILANADDPDFFLRKGIGWALREHAKADPAWVHAFVATYRGRLSPLSTREATRNLPPHADLHVPK